MGHARPMANDPRFVPVRTDDGSYTLRHQALDVLYRSQAGAQTESECVFVTGSRIRASASPWRVLELGFGMAWNFRLTVEAAQKMSAPLIYHAVEVEPLPASLIQGDCLGARIAREALPIGSGT